MDVLQFKTNINCGNCVNTVSEQIDKVNGIKNWEVETSHKNKTLTVRGNGLETNQILRAVKKAGFQSEFLGARSVSK